MERHDLLGQPMPRTIDEIEQLRTRVEKVKDLRNEEEKHCFAEMSENAHHGKCHAGKVTISVANKDIGWIEIVIEKATGDGTKREHQLD